MIKRFLMFVVCIFAGIFVSSLLRYALVFYGMPRGSPDLTVAIPLLLLFVPAFFFCRHNPQRVKSLAVCCFVSVTGGLWFFGSDFNQLYYTLAWAGAAGLCFYFREHWIGIMAGILAVFGAAMVIHIGVYISSGYEVWVIVRNGLYVAVLAVPVAQRWIEYAPPSQVQDHREERSSNRSAAA